MLILSKRHQIAIACVLLALLVATRGSHFPTVKQLLPSASWAVFFLAGVYLRPVWVLPALLAGAGLLDYAAITWGGVSSFCVSPAYVALLPAYGALWLAGRWYAGHYTFKPMTMLPLAGSTFVGTIVCEIISSGSFYFFSGRFTDPTLAEFATRFAKYFPSSLTSIGFWVAIAALAHAIVVVLRHNDAKSTLT